MGVKSVEINIEDQFDSEEGFKDEESDLDKEDDEDDCPPILLTAEEKKWIRLLWKKSLILKILGKRVVGFKLLGVKLDQLWKPKGTMALANQGNDFSLLVSLMTRTIIQLFLISPRLFRITI